MDYTLFGVIESKKEAKERASAIAEALAFIEGAPIERKCIASHWHTANYFITKAKSHDLDPNDHDGMLRVFSDPLVPLTARECAAMTRNQAIWKYYTGEFKGWGGQLLPTDRYCTTLHPKEIAYLEELKADAVLRMTSLRDDVRAARKDLMELRAIGDLPQDIAKRFNLTPTGERPRT